MAQYHAARQWSVPDGSPFFTYVDGAGARHTVWYDDAESLQVRLPLVGKYGLGGIAMWSFGNEDPGTWAVLRAATYGPNPFGSVETRSCGPAACARPGGRSTRTRPRRSTSTSTPTASSSPARSPASTGLTSATSTSPTARRTGTTPWSSLPAGQHQICAYGINVAAGNDQPQARLYRSNRADQQPARSSRDRVGQGRRADGHGLGARP